MSPPTGTSPVMSFSPSYGSKATGEQGVVTIEFYDFEFGPNAQVEINLAANDTMTVGRDRNINDFVVDSTDISRSQLEFTTICFDTDTTPLLFVRDLCSANGTYANTRLVGVGPNVTPGHLLKDRDIVAIGDRNCDDHRYLFKVKMSSATTKTFSPLQQQEIQQLKNEYIITTQVIGYGGSATVYLAYQVKTRKQLACKVYDLTETTAREEQKLMSGLNLSTNLSHPNVTSFVRAAKSDKTLYIFEELASGGDLYSLLDNQKRFTEEQVQYMMYQMLRGVEYMHVKGVVHRDLKLENVLCMTSADAYQRLALTDFGHAGHNGRRRSRVGTHGWQAPEVLQPNGKHTGAIDMWAMGLMAVYLLCGEYVNPALNKLEAALKADPYMKKVDLDDIFREINTHRQESPDNHIDRQHFIMRCLETNPIRRITAKDALRHPWFKQSTVMARKFRSRHEANKKSWSPCTIRAEPIITLFTTEEWETLEEIKRQETEKKLKKEEKKREKQYLAEREEREEAQKREKLAKLEQKIANNPFGPAPSSKKRTAAAAGLADETSPYWSNPVTEENPEAYPGLTSPDGKTQSPSQFCKDMSMKERRREFGAKGQTYRGLAEPALLSSHLPSIGGERSATHAADKKKAKEDQAAREEKKWLAEEKARKQKAKKQLRKRKARMILDSDDEAEEEEQQEARERLRKQSEKEERKRIKKEYGDNFGSGSPSKKRRVA